MMTTSNSEENDNTSSTTSASRNEDNSITMGGESTSTTRSSTSYRRCGPPSSMRAFTKASKIMNDKRRKNRDSISQSSNGSEWVLDFVSRICSVLSSSSGVGNSISWSKEQGVHRKEENDKVNTIELTYMLQKHYKRHIILFSFARQIYLSQCACIVLSWPQPEAWVVRKDDEWLSSSRGLWRNDTMRRAKKGTCILSSCFRQPLVWGTK